MAGFKILAGFLTADNPAQIVEAAEVGGLRLEERRRLRHHLFHADDLVAVRVQGLHEVDDLGLGSDEAGGSDDGSSIIQLS